MGSAIAPLPVILQSLVNKTIFNLFALQYFIIILIHILVGIPFQESDLPKFSNKLDIGSIAYYAPMKQSLQLAN